MKELDVLFERWHAQRYPSAPPELQAAFAALLECEDPDILAWLVGNAEAPARYADVIRELRGGG